MNAKDLMIKITKARGNILRDTYKQIAILEAIDAHHVIESQIRVICALGTLERTVSDLQADDIPTFIDALKAIVGDK